MYKIYYHMFPLYPSSQIPLSPGDLPPRGSPAEAGLPRLLLRAHADVLGHAAVVAAPGLALLAPRRMRPDPPMGEEIKSNGDIDYPLLD